MVLQELWVSQNFSRISRVSQSHFLSSYVRLSVSFIIRRCLGVSSFCTGGPNSLHERGRDSCLRAVLCYKRLFIKACMGSIGFS